MFIPLHDKNDLKRIKLQYVTLALIAANVLVFLAVNVVGGAGYLEGVVVQLGYIPAVVNDFEELPQNLVLIPEELSLISYAFLHADFMHLASNMIFLWVFGDNIEDALGHVRYPIFYLLCAALGGLAHGLVDPGSQAPLIGASGAVAGIIGAYLMLHPKVRIWVLVLMRIPLPLPAWIPLIGWIGFQFFMFVTAGDELVSWAAHIGGFFAGVVLVVIMKRRDVPLFDRVVETPKAVVRSAPTGPRVKKENRAWGR